jgi:hypothetical protein
MNTQLACAHLTALLQHAPAHAGSTTHMSLRYSWYVPVQAMSALTAIRL